MQKIKKLKSLTQTQKNMMDGWAERWIKKGLRVGNADWEKAENAIKKCYQFAKIPWPENVIRVANPEVGALAASYAQAILSTNSFWRNVGEVVQPPEAKRKSLAASQTPVYTKTREAVRGLLINAIGINAIGGENRAKIDSIIAKAFNSDSVGGSISWHGWVGGTPWISWGAFTSFFRDVCNLHLDGDLWERDRAYTEVKESCFYFWPNSRFVIICDLPKEIHREKVGTGGWGSHRLHNEKGPALRCDGWSLYMIHGVRVPPYVVEAPEKITVEKIKEEKNVEVRRIMRERFGEGRYLKETGAKIIDTDFEGARKGAASRMLIEDHEGERFLVGTDGGTGRVYYMPVDRGIKTCVDAHVSLCGFDEKRILNKS